MELWKTLRTSLALLLIGQCLSCGTILYPERKGQISGQLDPAIVILDAVGLLFGIVPGVIAFAVDFSNGTIYLPKGGKSKLNEAFGHLQIQEIELTERDPKQLAAVLEHETGIDLSSHWSTIVWRKGEAGGDVEARLLQLNRSISASLDDTPREATLGERVN